VGRERAEELKIWGLRGDERRDVGVKPKSWGRVKKSTSHDTGERECNIKTQTLTRAFRVEGYLKRGQA
jgi:hypothetical protein